MEKKNLNISVIKTTQINHLRGKKYHKLWLAITLERLIEIIIILALVANRWRIVLFSLDGIVINDVKAFKFLLNCFPTVNINSLLPLGGLVCCKFICV